MEIGIFNLIVYRIDLKVEFFCHNLVLAFGVFTTFIDVVDGIFEFFEPVLEFILVKTVQICLLCVHLGQLISNELFNLVDIPLEDLDFRRFLSYDVDRLL